MQSETPLSNEMPSISSRYQMERPVGSGGMGAVYRAYDNILDKIVAIKVLSMDLTAEAAMRFHNEARTTAKLDHPNIVKVLDFGQTTGGALYLIMDLIEGPTLDQYIKTSGPLSVESALPIFSEICAGLKHAHANAILHRDVKPSNIVLSPKLDGKHQVKILDFGLAKLESEDQKLTTVGTCMGSPPYMSPEQARGEPVDHRSDIYSMGCLMFKVLTGKPPFEGDTSLDTILKHVEATPPLLSENDTGLVFPVALEQIVSTLLEKDPSRRFQSFEKLQAAIDELHFNHEPISDSLQNTLSIDTKYATANNNGAVVKPLFQQWKFVVPAAICLIVLSAVFFMQVEGVDTKGLFKSIAKLGRLSDEPPTTKGAKTSAEKRRDGEKQKHSANSDAITWQHSKDWPSIEAADQWRKYGQSTARGNGEKLDSKRYPSKGKQSVDRSLGSDQAKHTYLVHIARLWREPEFAEAMNDPAVKQFLKTPDVWGRWNEQTAKKYGDQKHILKLMSNPGFLALTKDPQFQQLMRDARFRNYATDSNTWNKNDPQWHKNNDWHENRSDDYSNLMKLDN